MAIENEDWEHWYTIEEAADELGISSRTLQRHEKEGLVVRVKCPDKIKRFKPADIEKLGGVVAQKSERIGDKADLLSVAADLLRQSHAHNEKLIGQIVGPMQTLTATFTDQIKNSNQRIAELETKLNEQHKLHEEMVSKEHERNLEMLAFDAANTRKNEVMGVFKAQVPKVLDIVAAKSSKAIAAVNLIKSLDPIVIAGIQEGDFLTAEQKEQLKAILSAQ
jgi:DNA-binding transcriptional MerR regulator